LIGSGFFFVRPAGRMYFLLAGKTDNFML